MAGYEYTDFIYWSVEPKVIFMVKGMDQVIVMVMFPWMYMVMVRVIVIIMDGVAMIPILYTGAFSPKSISWSRSDSWPWSRSWSDSWTWSESWLGSRSWSVSWTDSWSGGER